MAKKLIDVQANGFKSYVDATATAVGAEPALGDPGPGTWYLRAIDNVRSWAASIPWAGVDKTGAVASDVGALDIAPIQAAGQLSGFADKANITQSYNEANRTVTTSHPSGTIVMYWKGARITRASPWVTAAHAATVNANYFYYSSDGVNFNWSTTPWEFEDIQVAMVRFGTSLKLPIRECHGLMDPAAHEEFHDRVWTYRKSGGALTAGTYALQVADDASITPGVDACVLQDEDLATSLDALPQGSYTVCIPVDGEFSPQTLTFPFPYAPSSFIRYYPADTGVGTTGQTGKFYNVYRVGIPTMDPNSPVRWLWIAPQAEYDSAALASAESFASLRLGDLKLGTSEYIPVERIVYKSGAAYASTGKVWIEATQHLERVAGVVSSVGASVLSGSGVAGEPTYWASPSSLASETAANFRTRIAALPVANPTATGTLTAPDVVVSNLAGSGTRMATLDSAGKIGAEEKPYRDRQFVQNDVAGTSTLKTFTVWNWLTGAAELVIAGSLNNSNLTYAASSTVSVYHGTWLLASVSVTIPVSGSEVPFKIRITPPSVGGFNQAITDVQTPTGTQITIVGDDESASTAMRIECTNAYNQQESRIHNVSIL